MQNQILNKINESDNANKSLRYQILKDSELADQSSTYNPHKNSLIVEIEIPFQIPLKSRLYKHRYTYSENPQTFGEAIRKARVDADMLAKELGEALGCHRTSVLNWENGVYLPTEENIQRLQTILKLPEDLLPAIHQ